MNQIEEFEARFTALEARVAAIDEILDILASHIDGQIDDIRIDLQNKIDIQTQIRHAREIINSAGTIEKKLRRFFKK